MLRKSSLREIFRNPGRFLAIFAIMALGVGFFCGLRVSRDAMIETADKFLTETEMHDFRLISTVGFDETCVEELSRLDGVEAAEGAVFQDAICALSGDADAVLRFHSLTEKVNTLRLTEGRMPESASECVIDDYSMRGFQLGDSVTISDLNTEEDSDAFSRKTYTIVGKVRSPLYLNFERGTTSLGAGSISAFAYLLPEGFTSDVYTEVYLKLSESAYLYSDAYDEIVSRYEDTVTERAEEVSFDRYDRLLSEGEEKISDAEKEYRDGLSDWEKGYAEWEKGEREIRDGEKELEDGEKELAENRKTAETEIEKGYQKLLEAQEELNEKKALLLEQETALEEGEKQISQAQEEIQSARKRAEDGLATAFSQLDTAESEARQALSAIHNAMTAAEAAGNEEQLYALQKAESEVNQSLAEIDDERNVARATAAYTLSEIDKAEEALAPKASELQAARKQIDEAKILLSRGEEELGGAWNTWQTESDSANKELDEAEKKISDGKKELEDGKKELEDARQELEDGKKELADGKLELDDARRKLSELSEPTVMVLDRDSNVGYACFQNDVEIVRSVSRVFPVFFFLVAALICMTTMTRLVDQQRGEIGVLKALGYSDGSIAAKYLFLVGASSLLGSVGGFFLGSWAIPEILWRVYGIMYGFAPLILLFDYTSGIVTTAGFLICVLTVTWTSCRRELMAVPAELIRPKAPAAGKRIFLEYIKPLWKRFGFFQKVSARNIFRYTKRLLMMVLGVAGCTALLMAGFGIDDSIGNIVTDQYTEISTYAASASFTELPDSEALREELFGHAGDMAFVHESTAKLDFRERSSSVTLVACHDGELDGFWNLFDESGAIPFPGKGETVVTLGLARKLGIKAGDTVTLYYEETRPFPVTVSAVTRNYIYHYAFVTPDTVQEGCHTVPEEKTVLMQLADGADDHALAAKLMEQDSISGVFLSRDMQERVGSSLDNLKYVILLILVCAGALAFVVIYNLTNISISERIRELSTLMVLGFYSGETARYVFRENLVMTAMGALAGLPLGKLLHSFVMDQIRIDLTYFPKRITPMSVVLSFVITMVFALIVDGFLSLRLKKINMAESLKSVE